MIFFLKNSPPEWQHLVSKSSENLKKICDINYVICRFFYAGMFLITTMTAELKTTFQILVLKWRCYHSQLKYISQILSCIYVEDLHIKHTYKLYKKACNSINKLAFFTAFLDQYEHILPISLCLCLISK